MTIPYHGKLMPYAGVDIANEQKTPQWTTAKALEQFDIGTLRDTPHKDLLFFHLMGQLKKVQRAGWKRYNIQE